MLNLNGSTKTYVNASECRTQFNPAKTKRTQRKKNRQKIVLSFFERICAAAQHEKLN